MIQIERRTEPGELAGARENGLAAAREAQRSGSRLELSGYEVVKAALADMQHGKCCYCEKREEQSKYRDVEHYRPRATYWWLTWTWDNLLFACVDCNREHKRDQFPLAPGSVPLAPEQAPPGEEHPLRIDPADPRGDPTTEIEFCRGRFQRRERWRRTGSPSEVGAPSRSAASTVHRSWTCTPTTSCTTSDRGSTSSWQPIARPIRPPW